MAFSLPGAFAAKLVHPERRVLAAMGDGAFAMSMSEIETAVREGVHFVILVWVDGGYGLIRWKEEITLGRTAAVSFDNPDFVMLAESFGAKGYRITSAEELLPTLEKALADDAVSIVACPGRLPREHPSHRTPRRAHRTALARRARAGPWADMSVVTVRIDSPAAASAPPPEGASTSHARPFRRPRRGPQAQEPRFHRPPREHVRAGDRGSLRRRAPREDARSSASATPTASRSTTCCPRPSRWCAKGPVAPSASVTSTCSSWAAPPCTRATSPR